MTFISEFCKYTKWLFWSEQISDPCLSKVKMNPMSRMTVGKEKLAKIEKFNVGAIHSGARIVARVSTPILRPKMKVKYL